MTNPAGTNTILDAQHNLPEQEKKILISSAAVPSRGPLLGNFKAVTPNPTPTQPVSPIIKPVTPINPISQSKQPEPYTKPPQAPIPPAPAKYTVDPYREPLE